MAVGPAPRGRACGPSRSRRELLTQPYVGWAVAHFEVGEGLGEGRRDAALLGRDPSSRRGTAALRELHCPALAGSGGQCATNFVGVLCCTIRRGCELTPRRGFLFLFLRGVGERCGRAYVSLARLQTVLPHDREILVTRHTLIKPYRATPPVRDRISVPAARRSRASSSGHAPEQRCVSPPLP